MAQTWSTPDGPRGALCRPPLSDWQTFIEANRTTAAGWRFHIEGVSAGQLRERARRAVLALALDSDGQPALRQPDADAPLIVTGHQPQFYHPGIWAKAFAATKAAEQLGGYGLNLAVDHDAGELAAEVPWRDGDGLHVAKQYLVSPRPGRPLETLPAPTAAQIEQFAADVESRLASLGDEGDVEDLLRRWRRFADGLREVVREGPGEKGSELSAGELGRRSRALYEKRAGVQLIPDVPVSSISVTPEFLLFFVHWVVNAHALLVAYNDALAEFRARHNVRSAGNPFPDLLIRPDGAVELPFWGLTGSGVRRKLYARREGDQIVLENLEGRFATVPSAGGMAAVEALQRAGVDVRPRAVPLTAFHRLFVADLFIHGTGGARYDEVTDGLIRRYFHAEPPKLAVVSATIHLPLGDLPVQPSALQALRDKLRDLVWNPQRYAWEAFGADDETDAQLAELVGEKERLIDEMVKLTRGDSATRDGAGAGRESAAGSPKKRLTKAIEATNARLYGLLAGVVERTEAQLEDLKNRARSGNAATRRTYPFFFHDADAVAALFGDDDVSADDATAVACCTADC